MKLHLEGTPAELATKGPALIKALIQKFGVDPVSLLDEDDLQKAAELAQASLPESRHPVLRAIIQDASEIYKEEISEMLKEIEEVLHVST